MLLAPMSLAALEPSSRVALITGANKGIGKEIARKLAVGMPAVGGSGFEPGLTTILACRDEELGAAAASEIPGAVVCRCDLTDSASIEATRAFVEREYGRLDVLVNNAAVCYNDATLYGKVPYTPFEEQADITVRTNFFGSLEVTRALLPLLRKSSSPRIINVASAAGRLRGSQALQDKVTSPSLTVEALEELMRTFVRDAEAGEHVANGWPNTCYGVSKLGLIALTRVLARDEPKIMVNAVDPGWCKTDQNLMQGPVSAERGATTPALLATLPDEQFLSGGLYLEEQEIKWDYSGVTRAL